MKENTPDNTLARLITTTTKTTRFETPEERAKRLQATVGKEVKSVKEEERKEMTKSATTKKEKKKKKKEQQQDDIIYYSILENQEELR